MSTPPLLNAPPSKTPSDAAKMAKRWRLEQMMDEHDRRVGDYITPSAATLSTEKLEAWVRAVSHIEPKAGPFVEDQKVGEQTLHARDKGEDAATQGQGGENKNGNHNRGGTGDQAGRKWQHQQHGLKRKVSSSESTKGSKKRNKGKRLEKRVRDALKALEGNSGGENAGVAGQSTSQQVLQDEPTPLALSSFFEVTQSTTGSVQGGPEHGEDTGQSMTQENTPRYTSVP